MTLPLKKKRKKEKEKKTPEVLSSLLATTSPHPLKKIPTKELVAFQISLPGSLSLKILLVTDASRMQAVLEHFVSKAETLPRGFLEHGERERDRETETETERQTERERDRERKVSEN